MRVKFSGLDGEYYAMIDSGSAITMFNKKFVDSIKHDVDSDCNISVTGIGGEKSSDGQWITVVCSSKDLNSEPVYFKFEGITFDMDDITKYYNENYNMDTAFAMIIGSDSLTRLKARINYKDNTLDINEEEV